jgi:competence protein ComEC
MPDRELKADILVLPLGGAEMASTLRVIRRVSPRALISSVDALNRNGSPSAEWKGVLQGEGIDLFRQDETGAVMIKADVSKPILRSFLHPEKYLPLYGPRISPGKGTSETPLPR